MPLSGTLQTLLHQQWQKARCWEARGAVLPHTELQDPQSSPRAQLSSFPGGVRVAGTVVSRSGTEGFGCLAFILRLLYGAAGGPVAGGARGRAAGQGLRAGSSALAPARSVSVLQVALELQPRGPRAGRCGAASGACRPSFAARNAAFGSQVRIVSLLAGLSSRGARTRGDKALLFTLGSLLPNLNGFTVFIFVSGVPS